MVEFFFEDVDPIVIDQEKLSVWLSALCVGFQKNLGEVSIVFCSDEYLLEMNREHLNHDYYTDIITFDYCEGSLISGDLFISIERVADNASTLNEMFHVELLRVIAHGTLHLLGFKDKSEIEEAEMRKQEALALALYVSRETPDH
jgi:rRNA maturation RNase YbeY